MKNAQSVVFELDSSDDDAGEKCAAFMDDQGKPLIEVELMPSKEQEDKSNKLKEEIRKTHKALSFTTNDDIVNAQRKMKRLKATEELGSEEDDDDKLLMDAAEESDDNRKGRGRCRGKGRGKGKGKKRKDEEGKAEQDEGDDPTVRGSTESQEGCRKKEQKIQPEESEGASEPSKKRKSKETKAKSAEEAAEKDEEKEEAEEDTPKPKKKKSAAKSSPMQVAFKAAQRAVDKKSSVKRKLDFDESGENADSTTEKPPKRTHEISDTQHIFGVVFKRLNTISGHAIPWYACTIVTLQVLSMPKASRTNR